MDEINKLWKIFNLIYFDSDYICKLAKESGMKYIVITAKHLEGFCLFNSKVSNFNIFKYTGRDLIKEMAEYCKKYDLKLGLYYSQVIDWDGKDACYFKNKKTGEMLDSCFNNWDFNTDDRDYGRIFKTKMIPQVEELLTNYGDIFLIWFDMPLASDRHYSEEFFNLVKRLHPNCLINSRLSNGMYDFISIGDNCIPEDGENLVYDSHELKDKDGNLCNPYNLFESACTLNDTYCFSTIDNNWKSSDKILENRLKLEKLGVNYFINVGPDHLERIPHQAINILKDVEKNI